MALRKVLSAFGKLAVVGLVAIAFAFGLLLTVYLSLRSPDIKVPEVVNKNYLDGETELAKAGLDIRERAKRYKPEVPPGVILDQSPRPGEVIKAGQTVAVVVSRAPREGERPPDEEVAEERREEEKTGTRTDNSNVNANANRERRRTANRNANAGNANANANAGGSANDNATRNGADPNTRNANAQANRNLNANRDANARNANQRNANARNSNSGTNRNANTRRPAGANANRQP